MAFLTPIPHPWLESLTLLSLSTSFSFISASPDLISMASPSYNLHLADESQTNSNTPTVDLREVSTVIPVIHFLWGA